MTDWASQEGFAARFDWGPQGVERLAGGVAALVVVDVLRFTSAVETACAHGLTVYPYRWKDASAREFAASVEARLAGLDADGPSLSPQSLLRLAAGSGVVLPSPNGATCALIAAAKAPLVIAACLRNAAAVGSLLRGLAGAVAVIACGEAWQDGSIRPSFEDLAGAGAVLAATGRRQSPEAAAAVAAFREAEASLRERLRECASGRELVGWGLGDDVDWCAELDSSGCVPVLREGAFRAAV
jgi:2-phosphosulfolactate phosphatase